jgi:hypothetical protein
LADFGVDAVIGGVTFKGILDRPTDVLADGMMLSDSYDLTYATLDAVVQINASLTVDGVSYKVRDVRAIDNGTFSIASLSKI